MNQSEQQQEYLIEDFSSYALNEDRTIRNGFFVCANFGEPSPYARCFEGYRTEIDVDGVEQIEQDTFYIAWVNMFNERGHGLGTALISKALKEARRRGFQLARMEVENPSVVSVFRKIGQAGIITNVQYALSPMEDGVLKNVVPTAEFYRNSKLLTSVEAAAYLNSFEQATNGMVLGSSFYEVECVLKLA